MNLRLLPLYQRSRELAALLLLLGTTACQPHIGAVAPERFAVLQTSAKGTVLRAVSPTAVVYRVRLEKLDPAADLAFWHEALGRKLKNDGYLVTATTPTQLAGKPAVRIDAVAPLANADYRFTIVFTLLKDYALVVETAGERVEFDKVAAQVETAVGKIAVH